MTSVADVARELRLADGDVLEACLRLDIVASSAASGLSAGEHRRLRAHFGADEAQLGSVPRGSTDRDPHAGAEAASSRGHHDHDHVRESGAGRTVAVATGAGAEIDTWTQIRDERRMWKFFGQSRTPGPRTNVRRLVRWSVPLFGLIAVGLALFALNRDDDGPSRAVVCVDFTSVGATTTVDCATPHDAEIVAQFDLDDDGAAHPGSESLLATAGARCPAPESIDEPGTRLRSVFLVPTTETWAAGDRTVLCLVEDPSAPLVGPVADG